MNPEHPEPQGAPKHAFWYGFAEAESEGGKVMDHFTTDFDSAMLYADTHHLRILELRYVYSETRVIHDLTLP